MKKRGLIEKVMAFLVFLLLSAVITPALAIDDTGMAQQQKTVSGKVVDETGTPLPGVAVVLKGSTTGTVTNADGNYSLQLPAAAQVLVFSFVGMQSQEVIIGAQTTVN